MRKIQYLLLATIFFGFNNINANAGICDKENIDKLKYQAESIKVEYELDENNYNENLEKENGMFIVKVTGMPDSMYFKITGNDSKITNDFAKNNVINPL